MIVTRTAKRFGRHEIGQQPPIGEQSLSFTLPGTNENILWKDEFDKELGSANFLPMLLDVINGTAYLVNNPMGCLSYDKWGRPNPPYVVFKYQHNEWQRIVLEELPDQIELPNLILSSPDTIVKKIGGTIVSADVIQQVIAHYPQPEYKTILRKPMAKSWCQVLNPSPKAPLPMAPIQEK